MYKRKLLPSGLLEILDDPSSGMVLTDDGNMYQVWRAGERAYQEQVVYHGAVDGEHRFVPIAGTKMSCSKEEFKAMCVAAGARDDGD